MAFIPKSKRRPWMGEQDKPQTGRLINSGFYHTAAWRKLRRWYITLHPLCEMCNKDGKTVSADIVDHKKRINRENPFNTQGELYGEPLDPENLQSLCTHHHAVKSGRERHEKT